MRSHTLRAGRDLDSQLGPPFHFTDEGNDVQKKRNESAKVTQPVRSQAMCSTASMK